MMTYIATFYSHYGAIQFPQKSVKKSEPEGNGHAGSTELKFLLRNLCAV